MNIARTAIGVAISENGQEITAAAIQTLGRGLEMRCEFLVGARIKLSKSLADRLQVVTNRANPSQPLPDAFVLSNVASLSTELAEYQNQAVQKVLAELRSMVGQSESTPLILGSLEPGIWYCTENEPPGKILQKAVSVLGLCDAARLAELTQLCVVDNFHAKDLAAGGNGGPIDAVADWLLLHDVKKNRALLRLDRTARFTFLPSGCESLAAEHVFATEIGPGLSLLESIANFGKQTNRNQAELCKMAVQGKCIQPLLHELLSAPYFEQSVPRWSPVSASHFEFLTIIKRTMKNRQTMLRDLLCTATHFIAQAIGRELVAYIPDSHSPAQILFADAEAGSGLLIQELLKVLPPVQQLRLTEVFPSAEYLTASSAAILAMLHVDQIPQTGPMISSVESPRVLGRLTPGSAMAWRRLLQEMTSAAPATMSLRSVL